MKKIIIISLLLILVIGCVNNELLKSKCLEAKELTFKSLSQIDDIIESERILEEEYNYTNPDIINWSKEKEDTTKEYNKLCGDITGEI